MEANVFLTFCLAIFIIALLWLWIQNRWETAYVIMPLSGVFLFHSCKTDRNGLFSIYVRFW